jgi:hypothetical protein
LERRFRVMVAMAVGDGQMDVWSIFIFIVFFASVPPLAPIVLLVLGDRRDSEANHA